MSYELRKYADLKLAISDKSYAEERGFIVKHYGPYHIIKYNRNNPIRKHPISMYNNCSTL